ncbi:MAG: hypothetical protein WCL47_07795 [Holophagaceae bacterium]
MRTISLQELQAKGASILDGQLELALVEGAKSSFFLIPVQKGFEQSQADLLSRALAKGLLLHSQLQAQSAGLASLSMVEISAEVREVRSGRVAMNRNEK